MAQVFLTNDVITYEALRVLENQLGIGNRCIRTLDDNFGVDGAKQGNTLRVRKPPRVTSTTGPVYANNSPQDEFAVLQTSTQVQVSFGFTSADLALSIDDFSGRYVKPTMVKMASDIDALGVTAAVSGYTVSNVTSFGGQYGGSYAGFFNLATPGAISAVTGPKSWTGNVLGQGATSIATALQPYFDAGARLDEQAAPTEDRYVVLSPSATAFTVPQLFLSFNPQSQISDAFKKGIIGEVGGFEFYKSQNIPIITSGTWTNNANVNVASANGDTTLTVNLASGKTVVAGDQFVVAGVNSINPINYIGTGFQQVFTVTAGATANAAGAIVVPVYPPIQAGTAKQTINALPAQGANVVFMGTSNTSTQACFAYQKGALALGVAPLATDMGASAAVSSAKSAGSGLAIRYVDQYQGLTDQRIRRFDILVGWGVVRPELGCKILA